MPSLLITGIPASPGYAIAPAFRLQSDAYIPQPETVADAELETERFQHALQQARTELEAIRESAEQRLGGGKAEIFEGHLLLLEDPDLIDVAIDKIRTDLASAPYALYETAQTFIQALKAMEDELLQARAVDIEDVTGRVINILRGSSTRTLSDITEPCILIARDLTPSDTAQLNPDMVRGFITEAGSRTSHSAIMARSLDIPAIVGAGAQIMAVSTGTQMIIDALAGEAIIGPSEEELTRYQNKRSEYESRAAELSKLKNQPTVSSDGYHIELAANIGSIQDVQKAIDNGAEAIGLFRTEFLYMGRSSLPTEEEQFNSYKYVLEKMQGKPVVIRTLDIGGDKELPYLNLPKESNPFLGLRALRFCLANESLFRTQLRALLRASSYGNLKIMFPMIAVPEELREAKRLLREEREKLLAEGIPVNLQLEVGMMIEVPAAAIAADLFAKEVDFFSIGTNDLIQYTMAADRMNETVSYLYQPHHPSILRLVAMIIRAAKREGKWVGMCGEMAGDAAAVPLLLGLGLHEFSMSAGTILATRELVAGLPFGTWSQLAEQALSMGSQQEVKDFVQANMQGGKQ
ncbi:phosphoenolpyruvate--protein phosphotransferase [Paenibacillus sepulcri]